MLFSISAGNRDNPISIESLLQTHPQLEEDEDSLLELIYGEFCVRESLGEQPASRRILSAVSIHFAERLERLLEVHRALDSGMPSFASVEQTVQVSDDQQCRPSLRNSPPGSIRDAPASEQRENSLSLPRR